MTTPTSSAPLGGDVRRARRVCLELGLVRRIAPATGLILLVLALDGLVFSRSSSLHLSLATGAEPLLVPLPILGFALYYARWREGEERIAETLLLVAMTLWFTQAFGLASYLILDASPHDGDAALAAVDQLLGVSTTAIADWVAARPLLNLGLELAYASFLVQFILVAVALGLLLGDTRAAWQWLTMCVFGAALGMGLFWFFPAKGPPALALHPSLDQLDFLRQYDAVRAATPFHFTVPQATGIITFPSFHTFFGLANVWAFRGHRRAFVAMALLNACMIAATVTTGWHYAADVLASFALAAAAIGLVHAYEAAVGDGA